MSGDLKFHFDDGSASTPCFSLSGCVLVMKVMVKLVTQGLFKRFYFRNNKKRFSQPMKLNLRIPTQIISGSNLIQTFQMRIREFTNFQSDCDQFSSEKSCDRLSRPK